MANGAVSVKACSSDETLSVEVTTHCNSKCPHCFARAGKPVGSSLGIDLVKEIIAEGYVVGFRHLHITGGEPLLWEGLFETLDYSFEIGYRTVFINTNGTRLRPGVARKIATYRHCSVSVSLDGNASLHNHFRGEGTYPKVISGIEAALNAGVELVVFTVARKSLMPFLPHFAEDVYRQFPDIAGLTLIQLFSLTDNGFALPEEFLQPHDFISLVRTVSLLNLYGRTVIVKNNPLSNVVSKLMEVPWIPMTHPLYRLGSIFIMADRNISVSHSSRNSLGKYTPGAIARVMSSKKYQAQIAPDEHTCPDCRFEGMCRENGMLRPSEYYRDKNLDMPYCQRVMQEVTAKTTMTGSAGSGIMIDR